MQGNGATSLGVDTQAGAIHFDLARGKDLMKTYAFD